MAKRHCQRLCGLTIDDFALPIAGAKPLPKAASIPLNELPPVVKAYLGEDERGSFLMLHNRIHADVVVSSLAYKNQINEQLVPLIGTRDTGPHDTGQSDTDRDETGRSETGDSTSQLPINLRSMQAFSAKIGITSGATNSTRVYFCLLYTSPSPRDATLSRMPSSA